jgi:membrane protein DedA with SNARE-associated domain
MNLLAYLVAEIPEWAQWFISLSYFGIFLLALVGAMSIFVPIPYTVVIFWLGKDGWDPFLLMIAGGFGAAVGELSGYVLGYYGRKVISEERLRKMSYLIKAFGRYLPIAVFLFAFTPLPDDLLFIPLGILRYKLFRVFIPSLLGKSIMCFTLAYLGKHLGKIVEDVILLIFGEGSGWIGSVILFVLLIIVLVILFKVDWEKVLVKYVKVVNEKTEN